MHSIKVSHHRGLCEVSYFSNLHNLFSRIDHSNSALCLYDSNLPLFCPSLFEKISSSCEFLIPIVSGEHSKNIQSIVCLLSQIEATNLSPLGPVLVVGGGSVQDICATALALIKRGNPWLFIPTTFLAQTDSCIGSKTSINSTYSKNQYGTFFSPTNVFICPQLFSSMSDKDFLSGIGDGLHYFFVNPSTYYDQATSILTRLISTDLSTFKRDHASLLNFISVTHSIKKVFIETDEFDTGFRKKLNLGHTFGHAFEALSGYSIPHGVAVLLGILYSEFLSSPSSFIEYSQRSTIFYPIIRLLSRYYRDNIILCY